MGIERARVVEVHSETSSTGRVGSGYLVTDRLVLTYEGVVGRTGATQVRPAGTAVWVQASWAWAAGPGGAAIVEVDDPAALALPSQPLTWGCVTGTRPLAVTAMGFAAAGGRPQGVREARRFFGHVSPAGSPATDPSLPVTGNGHGGATDDGMSGATLFAGAELIGVLIAGAGPLRAVPVAALAPDPTFARLVAGTGPDGLSLTPVTAPPAGFAILGGGGGITPGG